MHLFDIFSSFFGTLYLVRRLLLERNQASSLGTDIVQFLLEFITNLLRPEWHNRVTESSPSDLLEHITGFLTPKIKHSQNITSMDTISWDFDTETCVCACVASCLWPDAQV